MSIACISIWLGHAISRPIVYSSFVVGCLEVIFIQMLTIRAHSFPRKFFFAKFRGSVRKIPQFITAKSFKFCGLHLFSVCE